MRPWSSRDRRNIAAAGFITVAAGIILIITVVPSLRRIRRAEPVPHNVVDNIITDSRVSATNLAMDDGAATFALQPETSSSQADLAHSVALEARQSGASQLVGSLPDRDVQKTNADLEHCRRLLDRPAERRVFVVSDGRDGRAQQQVASIVERTTRLGFFKITVSQGIVIDPRHPNEATVFALLVQPNELDRLRDQLKVALPELNEETPADPRIVTLLADINQVRACPSAPLADVSIPREDLALRSKFSSDSDGAGDAAPPAGQTVAGRKSSEDNRGEPLPATAPSALPTETEPNTALASVPGAARERDATASRAALPSDSTSGTARARSQPDLAGNDPAKAQEMIVVFVWVCKPPPPS